MNTNANANVFEASALNKRPSVWGLEVKKRLLERGMQQNDLVAALSGRGIDVDKNNVSNLLYGTALKTARDKSAANAINEILDIQCAI